MSVTACHKDHGKADRVDGDKAWCEVNNNKYDERVNIKMDT